MKTSYPITHLANAFGKLLVCTIVLLLSFAASADEKPKGISEAPTNTAVLAGRYYCGDGLGYNVSLVLKDGGDYTAQWNGCLGKYGEAAGKWKLVETRIVLTPSDEKDMMKGHLKTRDVLKFKGDWIFVRADDRAFYDKHGVTRYSCFQPEDKK